MDLGDTTANVHTLRRIWRRTWAMPLALESYASIARHRVVSTGFDVSRSWKAVLHTYEPLISYTGFGV